MALDDILIQITKRYPDIVFTDKSHRNNLYLEFKTNTQLEYKYSIWYGTEAISASVGATLLKGKDNEYFWHYPFDPYGSDNIQEKENDCKEFIFEQLDILTKYKTRIIQKKNWFSQTFICEYLSNKIWTRYYKHSVLKTNFEFPTIKGRQYIYE